MPRGTFTQNESKQLCRLDHKNEITEKSLCNNLLARSLPVMMRVLCSDEGLSIELVLMSQRGLNWKRHCKI
jgi:hypothetical protein